VAAGRNALRRNPAMLLLTAASRAETLRSLGPRAITFSDTDGTQVALTFDAAGLLASMETLADNAVLGDALTEVQFSDYRDVPVGSARVKLPFRVVTRVAGDTTLDTKASKIEANLGLAAGTLAPPANAQPVTPAPAVPGGIAAIKLGDDAYLIGGGSHHSLAVGFKDQVVVVEAPLSDERSLAVLGKLNELFPGRPIRLVPTHYHFDHSGGIRTYVAKGATISTTPRNKAFIEKMAAAPHTIRPDTLSRDPKPPKIETFTGKKVISDGSRTLELHDVGPNPHVTEIVVAYLPKEKALFVADLISLNPGPFAPASPALVDFSEKIGKLGLQVDVLVPAHGRQGTMEDLKAALAARPAAN
jgi:YD repeat-containing protein